MTPNIKQRIEQIKNSEIPKGYKYSKVGIIPEDWEVVRLKDKFDRLSRKNEEGNTNVLTISAQYGLINQEEFFKKEIASDDKSNYYLLHHGEFAYNKSYSNGYPFGAIKRLSRYDKGVVSPLYICFSANSNNACPEYYEQYFEAGRLNHEIQAFAQEGARNHGLLNISVSDFFNSFILMPPIKEQKRIANILSAQDKVIECYEKKIEQLKRIKKYYLQNMFPKHGETVPKIRFKGFTDPWKQRKVGTFANVLSASRVHKDEWKAEGVPFYRSSDVVSAFRGNSNERAFISTELYDELVRSSGKLEKDDILITGGGSIGIPYIVPNNEPLYSKDADLIWIKKSKSHDSRYLYSYFTSNPFRKYINNISHVGAIAHYTIEQVKTTPVSLPSLDEQSAIGFFFAHFDNFITLHQRKLEEENKKKKALQQLLLTGIVRTN